MQVQKLGQRCGGRKERLEAWGTPGGMEATSQDRWTRASQLRAVEGQKEARGEGRTRSLQISDRKSLTL